MAFIIKTTFNFDEITKEIFPDGVSNYAQSQYPDIFYNHTNYIKLLLDNNTRCENGNIVRVCKNSIELYHKIQSCKSLEILKNSSKKFDRDYNSLKGVSLYNNSFNVNIKQIYYGNNMYEASKFDSDIYINNITFNNLEYILSSYRKYSSPVKKYESKILIKNKNLVVGYITDLSIFIIYIIHIEENKNKNINPALYVSTIPLHTKLRR